MKEVNGHPFIVEFYHAQTIRQNSCDSLEILMEYFPDGDLETKIRLEGTLDFRHAKIYAFQMFRALYYLHRNNICHRDITTSNMLLDGNRLALGDFGSAKKLHQK